MSTPQPPSGGQPERPEPTRPASEQPTVPAPAAQSGQPAQPDSEQTAAHPAESAPAAASSTDAPTTAVASSAAAPPPSPSRWRRWRPRPRRTWPWITGGAIVGLLVLLVIFGLGVLAGSHGRHSRFERFEHGSGHSRMEGMPGNGPGGYGGPGGQGGFERRGEMGPGGMGGSDGMGGPGGFGGPDGMGGHGGQFQSRTPPVVGSVASVNGATLVINQDGGAPVTVTTTPQTRVVGEQRASVTDLKAGDRVAVRQDANHQAVGVFLIPARAAGTVTAVTANQITLTRADGLSVAVDVTAVPTKPQVGDRVVAEGSAANNGTTLTATQLRVLSKPAI